MREDATGNLEDGNLDGPGPHQHAPVAQLRRGGRTREVPEGRVTADAGHEGAVVEDEDDDDRLRCTECGATTDVTAGSLHDKMGRTRRGTLRKGVRWLRTMATIVEQWRCDRCLDAADGDGESLAS